MDIGSFEMGYDRIHLMKKTDIIETLKNNYSRDIRKKLIKTLLAEETETQTPSHKIINQIFSYVLNELGWDIAKNTEEWDTTPLEIMKETFPQIEKTHWYEEQILTAKKSIDVEIRE